MMNIKTIQPKLSSGDKIRAFFTLKNKTISTSGAKIDGLNLGANTGERPEIIHQNRQALFEAFDMSINEVVFAEQVHGNRVQEVTAAGTYPQTDALITRVPGLALAIQVADCAAVLIADKESNVVAAVHAGWRGAAGDIVPRTMQKMKELGSQMEDCRAFISPCIGLNNFEVGPEVADQFPEDVVDFDHFEKPHLNLKAFLAEQLEQAGTAFSKIEVSEACTVSEKQFYSYRREGPDSGRMLAVIQINPAA